MDDKKTVAVHVVLGSLIALGLIMTSVTMLRTLGAIQRAGTTEVSHS